MSSSPSWPGAIPRVRLAQLRTVRLLPRPRRSDRATRKGQAARRVAATVDRAEITATRFTNEYHWGNFRGAPQEMMASYFDAFLYLANWGTRHLMFRVPKIP